jgi:3-phosphoshikimate 1-carboxyvinyltransferase
MSDSKIHSVLLTPARQPLRGRVVLPGSKSITNRALLLAALAKGTSRLTGALKSDDTARMAEALIAMGVEISEPDATTFVVKGTGLLKQPAKSLFLGNAGTATRFLTAAVALVTGDVTVDGDENMRKRPIRPLLEALAQLGVETKSQTGCPPVVVKGTGKITGQSVAIDAGLSSQYVSAILMLAACGEQSIEVVLTGDHIGARGYIDLTVAAMVQFGAKVEALNAGRWLVHPTGYHAADMAVEPDASAATYLWAAEKLTGGRIDLGLDAEAFTQPDAKAYALISAWPNMPVVIDGSQMQDAIPTLAVMAAFNNNPVRFTGIANLRVKECDRIRALSEGLNRIWAFIAKEHGDDLQVQSQYEHGRPYFAEIQTFDDHRIAMSFALAGLMVENIRILDPECVNKTFPDYWKVLRGLGVMTEFQGSAAMLEGEADESAPAETTVSAPAPSKRLPDVPLLTPGAGASAGSHAGPSPKAKGFQKLP